MDDYLNIYEYIGDEQREYSTATNVNKEEHEMVKITPQEVHQPTQINQRSTDTRETQDQNNIKNAPKATKRCTILMAVLIAVILLISLAAIVLSAVRYNVPNSEKIDFRPQGANTFNAFFQFKKDMEFTLMQLNNTLQQLKSTTTVQSNISQLHTQLDAVKKLAISVQAEVIRIHCGSGQWYRVAYLNMSDPSQQCPSPWRKDSYTGNINVCGRPYSSEGSCLSTSFPTIRGPYNRVCGRVIGYQLGSVDGFHQYANNDIDLDGINITHGAQRTHIWSYVAGITQSTSSSRSRSKCPCSTNNGQGSKPPSSIGDNYYCESGNPNEGYTSGHLYSNDPLWDGQQCEGTCCNINGTHSPPWFSVQLPAPTTDMIEVSICCDQGTADEDTPIALLDIYVQ